MTQSFAWLATAHLEGAEDATNILQEKFPWLDAAFLMENWYIIILSLVALGCVIGILFTNIRAIVRMIQRRRRKKHERTV